MAYYHDDDDPAGWSAEKSDYGSYIKNLPS